MGSRILHSLADAGHDGDSMLKAVRRASRGVTSYGDIGVDDDDTGLSVGRINPIPLNESLGCGRIIATGPDGAADYTGPQYWVEMTMPISGEGFGDSVARMEQTTNVSDVESPIILATNLPECAKRPAADASPVPGCHLLDVGTPVWVYVMVDEEGVDRYVIIETPRPAVRIVDDTDCGDGVYNGVAMRRRTTDLSKAAAVTATTIGTAGPTVIIVNMSERDSATHWLTHADNANEKDFVGRLSYVNSDGTPVIAINGFWGGPCEVPPPPPP